MAVAAHSKRNHCKVIHLNEIKINYLKVAALACAETSSFYTFESIQYSPPFLPPLNNSGYIK